LTVDYLKAVNILRGYCDNFESIFKNGINEKYKMKLLKQIFKMLKISHKSLNKITKELVPDNIIPFVLLEKEKEESID
jgi:hypothetical protein